MKLNIVDTQRKRIGEQQLPSQFQEAFRPDLIKRAVHALHSAARQAYGAYPEAGMRHSSTVSKRRRDYRGCYGFGVSRVARKIHSRRGTRMNWVGTTSPQTVGGRRSHPPKSQKELTRLINTKENRKAIRSAMAATVSNLLVSRRGHLVPQDYPFILDSRFESLSKTKDIEQALVGLGFTDELERCHNTKINSGRGKRRGRVRREKRSLLIVVSEQCPLVKAAQNVPGIDVIIVSALNADVLAPGALPGRATLWTQKAVEQVEKENLFI
ncbi:TPA: 50S ribosomal protein L4 [Candidatus Woesearchaeota archaeon]|nr:50S ribosomal protein L4P [uncultured archaeon]HIH11911.1 50S ribosomal protein L4 [Candidatus Woesearchaeota archaeon]